MAQSKRVRLWKANKVCDLCDLSLSFFLFSFVYRAVVEKVESLGEEVDALEIRVEELQQRHGTESANIEIAQLKKQESQLRAQLAQFAAKK